MIDPTSRMLERYMDTLSLREKLVASNIANADTPGYKTRDIDFQSTLANLMEGGEAQPREVEGLKARNDGNNVSMDREARLLSETALRFNMASTLLRGQIRVMRSAIREGKG